jgi:Lrp/AsnC family transcriptional regulator, leucine-responsive regulatory protein
VKPRHTGQVPGNSLDEIDTALLDALQADGRATVIQLSRHVRMSASAVTERLRRLEETGVITGYRAEVDPAMLGYGILAFLRLRYPSSNYAPLHRLLDAIPEVLEAHHVTGDDCFMLKVVATSMHHLEQINGRIGALGSVTTSIAYSSPISRRPIATPSPVAADPDNNARNARARRSQRARGAERGRSGRDRGSD